ncbi:MAG: hypothetical protein IT326_05890 [Anaerolineae bacterium]|nr:hypothetical protein [Anaerolineae bacterium]
MAINVVWLDPARTILCWQHEGVWDWDSYMQAVQETEQALAVSHTRVDCVFEHCDSASVPPSIAAYVRGLLDSGLLEHPRMGRTVFVGDLALTEVIRILGERVYPQFAHRLRVASCLDGVFRALKSGARQLAAHRAAGSTN